MMKSILVCVMAMLALAFAGCATVPGATTPTVQLGEWCPTATAEVAAFQSVKADLSADAQNALLLVQPMVGTLCSPAAIAAATAGDVSQFTQTILPALTVIAVEYATMQSKGNAAAKPVMGVL